MKEPNKAQAEALRALKDAMHSATAVNALDLVHDMLANPDSINDVCDAVDELLQLNSPPRRPL